MNVQEIIIIFMTIRLILKQNELFLKHISCLYWVERKVFAFLKRWCKHKLPGSFYKAGIEKLVTRWETVITSNGNYIID
jgi:hypothetical protein